MGNQMIQQEIFLEISQLSDYLINLRRTIHKNPELRFVEYETTNLIQNELSGCGLEFKRCSQKTGIIATLFGEKQGKTIGIRADMDALPRTEKSNASYVSGKRGVMHACGHDANVAIGIGTAKVLSKFKSELAGNIKFIFQPAEEIPAGEKSGAQEMIRRKALLSPPVEVLIGYHMWPELEVGKIGIQHGTTMAAADLFQLKVIGEGAHAGTPHEGKDALTTMSHTILALQSLISRETNPQETVTLNIGTIKGGISQSVVPESITVTGTLRTANPTIREKLLRRIRQTSKLISASLRCKSLFEVTNSLPPVINDEDLVENAYQNLREVMDSKDVVILDKVPMTSEDFGLYLKYCRGIYLKIGSRGGPRTGFPLHHESFDIDERCLEVGVRGVCILAKNF